MGQKFGRLEVVSFNGIKGGRSYWNCVCECGNKTVVQGSRLISGHTTSCGCLKKERTYEAHFKDLTGQVFGRLMVVSFDRRENKITYWNCICNCGTEKVVMGSSLISGDTTSCGCLKKEIMQERCGSNNPNWLGGISFEPYCPLWTKELRERIRSFFDNECVICGKAQEENSRQLSCHHITYDKNACCDGKPVQFSALCGSCHMKTNFDRERWESMLHRIIGEVYEGRSYFTKEEYRNLVPKTILAIKEE